MRQEYVLVTGATGFIGSHVALRLSSENKYRVITIARKIGTYKNANELKKKGVVLFEGIFYDKNILEEIFHKFSVQHVIHIAALRGVGAGTTEDYHRVNVLGTEILLEASMNHQVKKFIFCSSVGVFGTIPEELPAGVNTGFCGDNDYHKSKILAEAKVRGFIEKGLDGFIVRPAITYGKGDNGFPSVLVKLVEKKMLLLPLGDIRIHLLDVTILGWIFTKILKTDSLRSRVFIAADGSSVSLKELADIIHFYYHHKYYPPYLKLPSIFFNTIRFLSQIFENQKWTSRIQLISEDWYYDITETISSLGLNPANTKMEFLKYLQTTN
jgi:nucleoside-diphosphate-sugar epimerase